MSYAHIEKATNTKLAARRAGERRALRRQADTACLWGLCANAACRRAGACRGDPHDCISRYLPLVPEEVNDGVRLLAEGREHGLTYEDLRTDHPLEMNGVREWSDLVLQSARRRAR